MSDEVIKIIKIETEGSNKTVKDLREEIKSLRDDLVNVEKGTEQYDAIVKQLVADETKLTDVMRAGKNEVSAATGSYNALQNEMTSLRKVWKEVTDEAERQKIGARIKEINDQLKDMDASIGNNQRKVGSYEEALQKVTGAYVSQKQELKNLKVELEQLEPGTEAYNKAFMRAAEITHNLAYQQEMLKYSSTDLGDQLNNIRGIGANMAAGFSAVNAAMGLFGAESEDVQKAMLKVQQAMALVQGLQGMDGFIKRTKGLSNAITKWITESKTATAAQTAQATATKAAATATNAETVATEGATVAQKGLNAAMKANPIGLILTAVALLIANWKTLTTWLGKAVGGFDNLKKAINRVKQVISGLANVIAKALLVPIKEAINYVTTLGKVLKDVFTLNWDEIGKDIKNGITKSVDIVKDGYDIAGNYAVGKEKEITKQTAAELKKRASDRKAELDDVIADNEAKYGSDWKYTEDGEKVYKEYFDSLLAMYKKDSKEYKEAQRDKWSYEKELEDKRKKANTDATKTAQDAAKKTQEAIKKIETDYQSKVASKVGTNLGNIYAEYDEKYKAFIDYYENLAKMLDKSASATDKKLAAWLKKYSETVSSYNDLIKKDGARIINETKAFLKGLSINEFGDFFKQSAGEDYWEKQLGNLTDEKKLEKWNKWVEHMGEKTGISFSLGLKMRFINERNRIEKLFESLVNDSVENSSREANKKINDEIIQLFEKNIIPDINEELNKLQLEINKQTIKLDFEIETGFDFDSFQKGDYINVDGKAKEFEKVTAVYSNSIGQLEAQLDHYKQIVKFVDDNGLIPSDSYKEALAKIEELNIASAQTQLNFFNAQAEIRRKYFDKDLSEIELQTQKELREAEYKYNALLTEQDIFSGVMPKREMELVEQLYQIQKHGLEEQLSLYQQQLNEQTLTANERISLEQTVAEITAEIEEGEVAHTIEMTQRKQDAFMEYYAMLQDGMGAIGDLFGSLADYYEADIEAQVKAGKMSEEQADEQFENIKKMRIAEAIINTLAGSIGTFLQATATYPPPFGAIIGAVSAAAVAAAGFAQVQQIKNQTRNGSSTNQSPISTPTTPEYTPNYVENPTGNNEVEDLRNTLYKQPIKAYVVESDITNAQHVADTRQMESSF